MIDTTAALPFFVQVLLLVAAAAAIGFAIARHLGTQALARERGKQDKTLDDTRKERDAIRDELEQTRGKMSSLASEAERTRVLAAGFRRRADELEANLREAHARASNGPGSSAV